MASLFCSSSLWLTQIMFSLLLLVILQQHHDCYGCLREERIALLDIKSSFSGDQGSIDPYSKFMSWNNSTDCCSWDGVQCSSTTKQVTRLDVSSTYQPWTSDYTFSMSLFLPFKEMRALILSDNNINGCIPITDCFGSLAGLKKLDYLDLSDNYFNGKDLSSLGALASLKGLSLGSNHMGSELFISGM
ncbi:Leucine-rich repeat-containing N-terminal plant-type protein [Dioscorea alata]|uniref:Leucine-rich repeat-containing N-terminal plant-type protein n=1 Tax=Dioscorea alata TaxID=55571 RepID=A0ACB7WJB1_DIOAL|nr:Leucine-rich repeat-containing N-terminal plant-type protein [Dioscorea alata]